MGFGSPLLLWMAVRLNGGRAASFPGWPPEAGVGGGMGTRRGTRGFDYESVKGLRHNELVCMFTGEQL